MTAGFAETGGGPGSAPPDQPGPQPPWNTGAFPAVPPPPPPPPPPPSRRSPVLTIVVVLLALLVVAQAVAIGVVESQLAAADRKIDTLGATQDKQLHDVDGRVRSLEDRAAQTLDAASVAKAVLPSVFKITVPDGTATAFAIGTGTDGTDLLTNYHVVQTMWNKGLRSAQIDHDNQRFTVTIVRVDAENDVALLHTSAKFPRITAATATVTPGTPVVVIGAPQGFEQSVSGGVVSSLRTDVPGQAGKTLIQFDAAVNPGNSGGPLVNAQKQVIGIVEESFSGEGLHFAIPISVACTSFSGLC